MMLSIEDLSPEERTNYESLSDPQKQQEYLELLGYKRAVNEGAKLAGANETQAGALSQAVNAIAPDATSQAMSGSGKKDLSVWDLLNPFVFTEKLDDATEGTYLRPLALPLGAMLDVGTALYSPIRAGFNSLKAGAKGTKLAKPANAAVNSLKNEINAVSNSKNAAQNILSRVENAALGAADGMLASGSISPESAAVGAFFGGTLGHNATQNIENAEKQLVKFAKAPSYQQRWAKNYLNANYGLDIKESPKAIREIIKKEVKQGENIEDVIIRNEKRLDELNSEMSNLLYKTNAGKINIGMGFDDFVDDIKNNVYKQGREIGSSEGKKLEKAIKEIMKDIRITQLEKKVEAGEIGGVKRSLASARKYVEANLDNMLNEIPLTLQDADNLKRAMQKRTSIYKRTSSAMARAGIETRANAEGAKAINIELDLLKDVPKEIMEQGRLLKESLGEDGFEILNGAIDFKATQLSDLQAGIMEQYLKGENISKYRKINNERSNLIGKNDIFETMLAKFEYKTPNGIFTPNAKPTEKNKIYNAANAFGSRTARNAADVIMSRTGQGNEAGDSSSAADVIMGVE